MTLLRNNRGATAVEFALVALPVMLFMIGIMQTAYVVWIDNLLHISVNAAARCGAIGSTTPPCSGSGLANMQNAANLVFSPQSSSPTVTDNATCSANNGSGIIGRYPVTLFFFNLTLTAKSCYPNLM
jgi:Flp pilus assembly protein TadG